MPIIKLILCSSSMVHTTLLALDMCEMGCPGETAPLTAGTPSRVPSVRPGHNEEINGSVKPGIPQQTFRSRSRTRSGSGAMVYRSRPPEGEIHLERWRPCD